MAHSIWNRPAFWFTLLFVVAVHVAALWQPLVYLDRIFFPDDTYYTAGIARSIAQGLPPSTDGITATSGFQPLLAGPLVVFSMLGLDGDALIVSAAWLSGVGGILAIALLGLTILRLVGSTQLAVTAMVFATLAPSIIRGNLNGLETSLSGAVTFWLVFLLAKTSRDSSLWRFVGVGAVTGLAIWARIDTIFLIFAAGTWGLFRFGPIRTGIVTLTALVVASPWMAYCVSISGKPYPESGAAVRYLAHWAKTEGISTTHSLQFGALNLGGLIALPNDTLKMGVGFLLLAASLVAFARVPANWLSGLGRVLIITVFATWMFYVFYLSVFWFFDRYFYTLFLLITLIVACLYSTFWRDNVLLHRLTVGVVAGAILINAYDLRVVWSKPEATIFNPFEGARDNAAAAKSLLALLPDGSVLAASQSGAFSYYGYPRVKVVNLDGVVNGHAMKAIQDKSLKPYMISQGVTYLAAWESDIAFVSDHSIGSALMPTLKEVGRGQDQAGMQFIMFSLDWERTSSTGN